MLPLSENGTHMVIFKSTNSFITLESEKFNAYLQEDGLDNISSYRMDHHLTQTAGKEYYQRSVKTIIQVGEEPTNNCLNPTDLPLDIIPEKNPYLNPEKVFTKKLVPVKFRVLFMGKPLENALVKVWFHPTENTVKMDTFRTNSKGWITANRHSGPNMVSCVHMVENTTDTVAQWQSYWGSLSFEYPQFFIDSKRK